jgi:hypothetical protein
MSRRLMLDSRGHPLVSSRGEISPQPIFWYHSTKTTYHLYFFNIRWLKCNTYRNKFLLGILQESLLPADVIYDGFTSGVKNFQGLRMPTFKKNDIEVYCIGHKGPRAASLPWRSERMKVWMCHVNKRYDCSCKCDVDMNDLECIVRNSPCMLLRKFQREKTLGEMWAAVIRTVNNLLRMAWLRTQAPNWGQSRSQLMLRRGPCWTYSRGASRRK